MAGAAIGSHGLLQFLRLRAEEQCLGIGHRLDLLEQLGLERCVLEFEIEERDLHCVGKGIFPRARWRVERDLHGVPANRLPEQRRTRNAEEDKRMSRWRSTS